jgi:hypothetical protein
MPLEVVAGLFWRGKRRSWITPVGVGLGSEKTRFASASVSSRRGMERFWALPLKVTMAFSLEQERLFELKSDRIADELRGML